MNEINPEIIEKKKKRASRILSGVYNLPTIPLVIFEITKVIDDPMASATQLGKIISKDQGLVTKILSVANSPLYGIPRRVSTIDFAIVILGFNHIKNLVIALSMMEAFKTVGGKKFEQKKYWYHSIITAFAAKKIADDLGYPISGEAFTGGLLHDLGIPVIFKYFNKEYQEITKKVKEESVTYLEAEAEVLGWTHSEIARSLVERWNLPPLLSDVVLFHHKPSEQKEGDNRLTAIVHLADFMTQRMGIGDFSWDKNYILDKEVIDILDLGDEDYLEDFIESYRSMFNEQLESINL